MRLRKIAALASASALAISLLVPASAQADEHGKPGKQKVETAATAIQEAVESAGQDSAATVKPDAESSESVTTNVRDSTVKVSKDGGDATALVDGGTDGLQLSLELPTSDHADDATVAEDGTTVFTDPGNQTDVGIQTLDDGAVRALTVINGPQAPTRYDYKIEAAEGVVLTLADGGAISLRGPDGSDQGMILPAWAVDANGTAVKTHYEVSGNTVTQVVEHNTPGLAYPVVADPKVYYAWWQLFSWSEWRWNSYYGMNQLSIELSGWGRYDVIFNAGQFLSSGWNLLQTKHSWWMFTASMWQQWECHVLGGMAEWGTFDLEYERYSNPNWRSRIGMWPVSQTCNW